MRKLLMMATIMVMGLLWSMPGIAAVPDALAPDMIMVNGKILTVDKDFSVAQAVAVKDGKIIAVGDTKDMEALKGNSTKVLDLKGSTVLPGLIDNHMHLTRYVFSQPPYMLDLFYPTVKSLKDVQAQLKEAVAAKKPGEWILGAGWNDTYFEEYKEGFKVSKNDLDAISPDNPVCFRDWSSHYVWANSKAMELAGITKDTPDPPGGHIERDPKTGEPTGLFLEKSAMYLIQDIIPPYTHDEMVEILRTNYKYFTEYGITSVGTAGETPELTRVVYEAINHGELPLRASMYVAWPDYDIESLQNAMTYVGTPSGFGDEWVKISGVKVYADGTPPAKTAWMVKPYGDGTYGSLVTKGANDDEKLASFREILEYIDAHGYQIGVHACGDRAMLETAKIFADIMTKNPWDARHYTIHGDWVPTEAMEIMAKNNIPHTTQTAIKYAIADDMTAAMGEEASGNQWPLKQLLDAGVVVSNSSDTPNVSPDWRVGVQSSVLREGQKTGKVSGPHQIISLENAIRSYTINAAWLMREDKIKGSIEPGKLADFCVIGKDIMTVDPHEIMNIPIIMTIVDGKVAYSDGALNVK